MGHGPFGLQLPAIILVCTSLGDITVVKTTVVKICEWRAIFDLFVFLSLG